jgi:hypothetical protein
MIDFHDDGKRTPARGERGLEGSDLSSAQSEGAARNEPRSTASRLARRPLAAAAAAADGQLRSLARALISGAAFRPSDFSWLIDSLICQMTN